MTVAATARRIGTIAATVLALLTCASQAQTAGLTLSSPARDWASEASLNEIHAIEYGHSYLRYKEHTKDAKGDHIRDVIESKDGIVARLVMIEGRPLTQEEDAGEHDRLQAMIDNPSAYAKHVKGDVSGKKMAVDAIKLAPDAMLYEYAANQPQRSGHTGEPEVVLDYKPNPAWKPPTTVSEALTGLQGRMWIDAKTHSLARMEGEVFHGINFGLFVVHIYPGGHLVLEQARVTEQRTLFTHFVEHVNVRVLFKSMKEDSDVETFDFSPVKEMSYQDAVKVLLATPLPSH